VIERQETEARTHHLSHALAVLGELEGCLNVEAGQEVARNLSEYYGVLRGGFLQVQFHPDRQVLEKYIAQVLSLREAWMEVEQRNSAESKLVNPPAAQQVSEAGQSRSLGDWRA